MINYFNCPLIFSITYYRVEIELDKKIFKQKYYSIYKLLNVTVSQEILNLEKIMDSLHTKLNAAKKTFEKNDVVELSKCWSEILSETNAFIDFVVESYTDIRKKYYNRI